MNNISNYLLEETWKHEESYTNYLFKAGAESVEDLQRELSEMIWPSIGD